MVPNAARQCGARRGHIAAVKKGVDGDRHACIVQRAGERGDVILMRMHPARRQEAHQMAGPARSAELADQTSERLIACQAAVVDGRIDPPDLLIDDAPGAETEMADLGIAHLTAGQPDFDARGVQQRVGAFRHESVIGGRDRGRDGVVRRIGAMPPAVEHTQHDRSRRRRTDLIHSAYNIGTTLKIR